MGHLKYATIGAIWADYGSRIMATLADEGLQNVCVWGAQGGRGSGTQTLGVEKFWKTAI